MSLTPYLLPLTVTLIVTVAIRLGNLKIVSVTVTMSVNVMKPMCGPKAKMMCVCDRVLIGQKACNKKNVTEFM